jgi:hypothetical protein
MLLAGVFGAPPALAQPGEPPRPAADQTTRRLDVEEIAPAPGGSNVEAAASAEEPGPYRPPSFPKMVLLDTGHVLTSPIRWQGRE